MHRSVLENAEFAEWATENVIVVVAHPKGSHKSAERAGACPKALGAKGKAGLDGANAKAAARFAEATKAKDEAAQAKAVRAVRDEFGQALTAGPLPAIADVDAWLSAHGATPPQK